jgi:Tol biopolymer transport system component
MQLHEPLRPPRHLRPDLPEAVERVILKALAKEPEARFTTAGAMAAAFAQAIAEAVTQPVMPAIPTTQPGVVPSTATAAQPAGEPTMLHRPAPFKRTPAWLWPTIAVLGIGVIVAALFWGLSTWGTGQTTAPVVGLVTEPVVTASPTLTRTPVNPSPTPVAAPSPGHPPADTKRVAPCIFEEFGKGLCIFTGAKKAPTRMLADTPLKIDGGAGWNPDGRQIVFSALEPGERPEKHNLYVVNLDSSGLTQLPQTDNDLFPVWSPDGEWLAFHGGCDLVLMRPDGSGRKHLWRHPNEEKCSFNPQWSPDSRRLIFTVAPAGKRTFPQTRQIGLISLDGAKFTSLITSTIKKDHCPFEEVAFSPDGQQIAYLDQNCRPQLLKLDDPGQPTRLETFPVGWTSRVYPQWGQKTEAVSLPAATLSKMVEICAGSQPPQICIRETQNNQVSQITQNLDFQTIYRLGWSPDGQQIVFDAGSDWDKTHQADHKLYLIQADGSELRQLSRGGANDIHAAWSPDGQWLAFHRNCELWLIQPNGSAARGLINEPPSKFCVEMMVWSPNSQQIAFNNAHYPDPAGQHEIWVINLEEKSPRMVYLYQPSQTPLWENLAWSPDGQQIASRYKENDQEQTILINADGRGTPQLIEPDQIPDSWHPYFWPQWDKK